MDQLVLSRFQLTQCLLQVIALGFYFFLLLHYFFGADVHFVLQYFFIVQQLARPVSNKGIYCRNEQNSPEQPGPPGGPPGRVNNDNDRSAFLIPYPVAVGCLYLESVSAGREVGVGYAAL